MEWNGRKGLIMNMEWIEALWRRCVLLISFPFLTHLGGERRERAHVD